jgi:5-methylthioribose kinase
MSEEKRFLEVVPNGIFISKDNQNEIRNYLSKRDMLQESETVTSVEKAGEGNMNCVLRVKTNYKSLIIKQSRPWVEKYPSIQAPVERVNVEASFIKAISSDQHLKEYTPILLSHDEANFIMILEDLGIASDYSSIYQSGTYLEKSQLIEILYFLNGLHSLKISKFPENRAMRVLNHLHIFDLPFRPDNGFDLDNITPGLNSIATFLAQDEELKKKILQLGQIYLKEGPVLIHGDYYPGSFLKTDNGLKIIDAEFSFKGFPVFDYGVLLGHLYLANEDESSVSFIKNEILKNSKLSLPLIESFAAIEVLRRLLGVAQLPLTASLSEKQEMIKKSVSSIKNNQY